MKRRYFPLGYIFHIFNKSIAGFNIFNSLSNKDRFIRTLDYYNHTNRLFSLSKYLKNPRPELVNLLAPLNNSQIKFIAYCIMPDHYHLLIKTNFENTLSKYMNDVENSYSRYFNIKFDRKGPLWQSAFKFVKVTSNNQLLHLSRYLHLNPTTSGLVQNPEDWLYSSYNLYINNPETLAQITEISISSGKKYQTFVENRKDYQITLRRIKKSLFE